MRECQSGWNEPDTFTVSWIVGSSSWHHYNIQVAAASHLSIDCRVHFRRQVVWLGTVWFVPALVDFPWSRGNEIRVPDWNSWGISTWLRPLWTCLFKLPPPINIGTCDLSVPRTVFSSSLRLVQDTFSPVARILDSCTLTGTWRISLIYSLHASRDR